MAHQCVCDPLRLLRADATPILAIKISGTTLRRHAVRERSLHQVAARRPRHAAIDQRRRALVLGGRVRLDVSVDEAARLVAPHDG
jgi:hypothetical protein